MMQSLATNLMRRIWILAIVLVAGLAFHPSAFAIDQCSGPSVQDPTYDVEETLCVYGDSSGASASAEADDNGYEAQEWDTTIIEGVGAEVAVEGTGVDLDTGLQEDGYAGESFTPVSGDYTIAAFYWEYLGPPYNEGTFEWWGPYGGWYGDGYGLEMVCNFSSGCE